MDRDDICGGSGLTIVDGTAVPRGSHAGGGRTCALLKADIITSNTKINVGIGIYCGVRIEYCWGGI